VAEKARILLVDDRAENIVALEAILSSLNQTLVPARSGDAALKALLSDEFAVILLDVLMPGMDGFETAAHIKRRPKTRDVPIIFLTARNAEPDYAFRSYSAGAVDYIAKPFDPWVLRAKVSVFVDLYTKTRQLSDQATMLRAQLGDSLGDAETVRSDADPVLAELSARLAAVEDMVTVLSGQASGAPDPAIAESMRQLEHRVARLRGVFDALRVDT
jgi:CheY-like chemotaxis protein